MMLIIRRTPHASSLTTNMLLLVGSTHPRTADHHCGTTDVLRPTDVRENIVTDTRIQH